MNYEINKKYKITCILKIFLRIRKCIELFNLEIRLY